MLILFSKIFILCINLLECLSYSKNNEKLADTVNSNSSRSFLIIGDWGKGGSNGATWSNEVDRFNDDDGKSKISTNADNKKQQTYYQNMIAYTMAKYASNADIVPDFVVSLGDNFYTSGVASTTDTYWKSLYTDIYLIYDSLKIPWYTVLGNHDWGYGEQGVTAQLERHKEDSIDDDSWVTESTNYTTKYYYPDGSGMVQIIYIDTTTLAPNENKCCNSNGGVSESLISWRIKNQLERITEMLNETVNNPPTWLLVAGHYPVYSSGDHGDTSELKKYLLPLLEQYNVHAYICGHDHISEHLQANNIEYFVVGAGTMIDNLKQTSSAKLVWYGIQYAAFGHMVAARDTLTMKFIDKDNNEKYSYTLLNPLQFKTPIPTSMPSNHPNKKPSSRVIHAATSSSKHQSSFSALFHDETSVFLSVFLICTMIFLMVVINKYKKIKRFKMRNPWQISKSKLKNRYERKLAKIVTDTSPPGAHSEDSIEAGIQDVDVETNDEENRLLEENVSSGTTSIIDRVSVGLKKEKDRSGSIELRDLEGAELSHLRRHSSPC